MGALRILVAAMTLSSLAFATSVEGRRIEVSPEEYAVYNAVLDNINPPKEDLHVLIFPKTMSFGCAKWKENVPLANGCSFLAFPPNTPAKIEQLLKSEWPQMSQSTWTAFKEQNDLSAYLGDSFVTLWKHQLAADPDDPTTNKRIEDRPSTDFMLILSRVGFNSAKNEAMLCVVLFSYMDLLHTGGDYFLLRLNNANQWIIQGRVRYFEFSGQDNDSK